VLFRKFSLNDYEEVLAECIQSEYCLSVSDHLILKQLVSSFVFVDFESNSIDGQYYAFFEDLSHIIADVYNMEFYKISIDFGNMFNLSAVMHRYDKTGKLLTEYISFILAIVENNLKQIDNSGLLLIRNGIDEYSFFLLTNDITEVINYLDKSISKVNDFAIRSNLNNLRHSKTTKKGGVYLKVSINKCDRIESRQIEFNWNKYNEKTQCKNIHPDKIILKNLTFPNKLEKRDEEVVRVDCISDDVISMNYLYPDLIRKSIFLDQNINKITDQQLMLMLYKTLHSEDSPFEIVKTNVEYARDIKLYRILSSRNTFKKLYLISYRWVNWAGILETFGEESPIVFNKLIHKNIIEGIYQFNREIYSTCRFYNDYGVLRVIVIPSHSLGELLLSKSDVIINGITNYINRIPVKYVFPSKSKLLIGEIRDPRNENNRGIKIITDIVQIEPNAKINTERLQSMSNVYSIYD